MSSAPWLISFLWTIDMAIDVTMPALSPTMEVGTLAKWHVKPGDTVKSGDIIAEIETDKATMEVEAVDEGTVIELAVPEGLENVPVGTVIMRLAGGGPLPPSDRIIASPLARRIADMKGIDLASIAGSGPRGRIVRADVDAASGKPAGQGPAPAIPTASPSREQPAPDAIRGEGSSVAPVTSDIPHTVEKLGNVRKVIARRLTEAKQSIPHIYLTLDVELDALLKLRGELNTALEPRGIKVSVNDLVIKALALGLRQVPKCNVSFAGDTLLVYDRADISVAVAAPSGLITPIIVGADGKAVSQIAAEMKALAEKARAGKLQPHEYQGGTASLSNLGMFGIKQFEAVINPPQAMILAVGAGEKRAVVKGDALAIATVMTITGSFDHRALDGADGAALMSAVKALIESPLGLVA
jgi:pyruvate dehydrogenase E2 component (dihydrolipoamide acetyltransferase)